MAKDNQNVSEFLQDVLSKNSKTEYINEILNIFIDKMFINSINDLINLQSHTWDSLSHHPNLGPIIIPIVKKEVEFRKINFKQKEDECQKTLSEILADVHKIKRYLYSKTKLKKENANLKELCLKDIAYLNVTFLSSQPPKFDVEAI